MSLMLDGKKIKEMEWPPYQIDTVINCLYFYIIEIIAKILYDYSEYIMIIN